MAFLSSLALAAAPSLVNGISNLLGTTSTNSANARQNELNRQWQSQENELSRQFTREQDQASRYFTAQQNELSRDWQEKMWNLQNQYNTPSAMMQRYKDAGMNPFLSQMAQLGQGAGSAGTPASSATAPMSGSAPMSGAPSSIPMVAPRFDLSLQDMGIASNIANQHANTQQQKWETYQYIREHVGRDAAKRFLDGNPDMFQSSDPDNDPWMKSYKRAEMRENLANDRASWELSLSKLYGVKQAEQAIYHVNKLCEDLDSQINKRKWDINQIRGLLKTYHEQIKTMKSQQSVNYSQANLNRALSETQDGIREYVVKQMLLNTNILDLNYQDLATIFESKESLRGWLTSKEAKEAFAKAARNHGLWNADAVRSSFLEFLDHASGVYFGSVSGSSSGSHSVGSVDGSHTINRSGSSSLNVSY